MCKPDSVDRTVKGKSIPVHLTAFYFIDDRSAVTLPTVTAVSMSGERCTYMRLPGFSPVFSIEEVYFSAVPCQSTSGGLMG